MATSGLENVVLNELELHSPGEDPQWVELFDIVDNGEDITGGSICPLNDLTKETFIDNCTSIGLAISRTIELQGGRIWMYCGPEIGCTIPGRCTNSNRTVKDNIRVVHPSELILSWLKVYQTGRLVGLQYIGNLFNECASGLAL